MGKLQQPSRSSSVDGAQWDVNRAPAMLRAQRSQLLKEVGARGGLKRRGPVERQCRSQTSWFPFPSPTVGRLVLSLTFSSLSQETRRWGFTLQRHRTWKDSNLTASKQLSLTGQEDGQSPLWSNWSLELSLQKADLLPDHPHRALNQVCLHPEIRYTASFLVLFCFVLFVYSACKNHQGQNKNKQKPLRKQIMHAAGQDWNNKELKWNPRQTL